MRSFNPSATRPERAVQAWQILIGLAKHRQTITYASLARLMYRRRAPGVLSQTLDLIARYCKANRLPQLNTIVVGKGRGTPGDEIPLDPSKVDATREKVYQRDWYDISAVRARIQRAEQIGRRIRITPQVKDTADHFEAEISADRL
jgi:hypothetical protein